ncbi:MAG: HEAT repeat domain-containing protein [Spirochaetaceae bacterium]|nr:HEAT repeat domain-containing protein [Spirochaetaceae bacterium]
MYKLFFCFILFFTGFFAFAQSEDEEKERYSQIMRYGTDAEIANVIQTIKEKDIEWVDEEIAAAAVSTKSAAIQSAAINYFSYREDPALEEAALDFLQNRFGVEAAVISASIDYLGKIGAARAQEPLKEIILTDEARYQNQALRSLGMALKNASSEEKEEALNFFLDFYRNKAPSDAARRVVIEAVGEGALKDAAPFLEEIILDSEAPADLRVEALNSAGKIGGADALQEAVIGALNAEQPLIRTAAVGALGAFSGAAVDRALLDAMRDSFFRTRLAAIKSVSKRAIPDAVGFLEFRAKNDDAASVREEAVRTLGAYQSAAAETALESIYGDKRAPEKIRLMAAEALVKSNPSKYTAKIAVDLEEARKTRQKTLYAGLVKAVSASTSSSGLKPVVESLLSSSDAADRAYALDIIASARLTGFIGDLQRMVDDPKNGLKNRAKMVLEKLK